MRKLEAQQRRAVSVSSYSSSRNFECINQFLPLIFFYLPSALTLRNRRWMYTGLASSVTDVQAIVPTRRHNRRMTIDAFHAHFQTTKALRYVHAAKRHAAFEFFEFERFFYLYFAIAFLHLLLLLLHLVGRIQLDFGDGDKVIDAQ